MIDRRTTLRGVGAAGALLALGAATPATAATHKPQSLMTEDQQLDLILKKLDSLPRKLKKADPKAYPNYERELDRYLGDTTVVVPSSSSAKLGIVSPNFNFGACIASLASFISSSNVPIIQIIALIKKALTIWNSFVGIWKAIQSGAALQEIGKEAVAILSELLGFAGVIASCLV